MIGWIEDDLYNANQEKNRKKWPWIIAQLNFPIYCTKVDQSINCEKLPETLSHIEELFFKLKVDLVIQAGIEAYERFNYNKILSLFAKGSCQCIKMSNNRSQKSIKKSKRQLNTMKKITSRKIFLI